MGLEEYRSEIEEIDEKIVRLIDSALASPKRFMPPRESRESL